MDTPNLNHLLDNRPDLRKYLFPRGFLLTNDTNIDITLYPFYNLWNEVGLSKYRLLIHKKQKYILYENEKAIFLLIGHAYEPVVSLEHDEHKLLQKFAELYKDNNHIDYLNLWTGSFVLFVFDNDKIIIYGDPTGMQTVFYGFNDSNFYASSHTNLIGDVCNIAQDDYVKELVNYRFYKLFGKTLPGDISPYQNFKRLVPNHSITVKQNSIESNRFFPTDNAKLYNMPYDVLIDKASNILKNSMGIIYKKWQKPAISLTGGCDSKTTLSCAKDYYDKYQYFSYISQDTEEVDAIAAKQISDILGNSHKTYKISSNDSDFTNVEEFRDILEYNCGSIGTNNSNDIRKRIFFTSVDDFDVEIKSWVSEVARAYYHKRFAKKKLPQSLSPRYATSLYKVFINNRKLVKRTDKIFAEYLNKYYSDGAFDKIPWCDLFFWEFRVGSWNGLVISGEHQLSYDITIPYNNRELLRLLLSTPLECRIKDKPHHDIIKLMNPRIYNCGISITNVKHTVNRAKIERIYLDISSKLPF